MKKEVTLSVMMTIKIVVDEPDDENAYITALDAHADALAAAGIAYETEHREVVNIVDID